MNRTLAKPGTFVRVRRALVRSLRRARTDVRGVSAIEFALVAPLLILMMVGTTDLGIGTFRKLQVQTAAHAGAQYAILYGFDSSAITTAVTSATSFSAIQASPTPKQFCGCASVSGVAEIACSSTCGGGSTPGSYVTVSTAGSYSTLFSYPGIPKSFQLTGQSTVRIQ